MELLLLVSSRRQAGRGLVIFEACIFPGVGKGLFSTVDVAYIALRWFVRQVRSNHRRARQNPTENGANGAK